MQGLRGRKRKFLTFIRNRRRIRGCGCIAPPNGIKYIQTNKGENDMKRIRTISTKNLKDSIAKDGCGECQTSCQSACKTSCGIANQKCEKNK